MFSKWFGGGRKTQPARARRAAVPAGYRVYAIGDIHGRLDLLTALHSDILDDSKQHPHDGTNVLIYLGDYIDRGPYSREVIEYLMRDPLPGFESVRLMGNHDEAILKFLEDPAIGPSWSSFGGEATLLSYGVRAPSGIIGAARWEDMRRQLAENMPESHVAFLRALKTSVEAGDYMFVHAGVRPGVPLAAQRQEDLLWIRDTFLDSALDHGKVVVHGHTPVDAPEVRPNRIGVDTGAFASGVLTAVVLEGESRRFICTGTPDWARVAAQ
jgi:serine/threonine protein phosphatase 1